MKRSLLIGIGNPYLGDDKLGIEVVKRAKKEGCPWDIEILYNIGFDLLDKIIGYEEVIIIDACKYGIDPGTILKLNKKDLLKQRVSSINTHGLTLSEILELGEALYPELMPSGVEVILIEAKDISDFSYKCSYEVETSISKVLDYLKKKWLK